MSCCSIKSMQQMVRVGRLVAVEPLRAIDEVAPKIMPAGEGRSSRFYARPRALSQSKSGVRRASGSFKTLTSLFASFFTRLMNVLGGKQNRIIPDTRVSVITPSPAKITPKVLPAQVAPLPTSDVNLPALSNKRNGAKPNNIWSGFRQGPDGNCVTVSAIKAAMYRFGQSPTDIFKKVRKTGDLYHIVMRDDFRLNLTERELAEGARAAKFTGSDQEMLKDARFLFAASAKRAQMENNDRTASSSYQAAVRSLNNGEDETGPGEGFLRLGLRKHMKRVSVRELAAGQLGMCNRAGHSVAVINGREELWGRRGSSPTRGQAVALI